MDGWMIGFFAIKGLGGGGGGNVCAFDGNRGLFFLSFSFVENVGNRKNGLGNKARDHGAGFGCEDFTMTLPT